MFAPPNAHEHTKGSFEEKREQARMLGKDAQGRNRKKSRTKENLPLSQMTIAGKARKLRNDFTQGTIQEATLDFHKIGQF